MAEFPAMPLFTDVIIADTVDLNNEQFGCYMRLLIYAWRRPECDLPSDHKRLQTVLGVTPKKFRSIWPSLEGFFIETDGVLIQKKLSKVRRKVAQSVDQKRKAGEASARARALKINGTRSTAVGSDVQRNGQQPKPNLSKDKEEFYSNLILKRSPLAAGHITPTQARALVDAGYVTEVQCKEARVL